MAVPAETLVGTKGRPFFAFRECNLALGQFTTRERLDNIVKSGFHIVVGDADVEVFCSGDVCRNNLGDWPTRKVQPAKSVKGFQFYAAKDREMALAADVGLMIWDGKNPGTVLNMLRLIKAGKKAVLLNSPEAKTTTFKAVSD